MEIKQAAVPKKSKVQWDGYRIKRTTGQFFYKLLFYSLLAGLCFIILYPLLKILPIVFGNMGDLGNPDIIWVPKEFSLLSFKAAFKFAMSNSVKIMGLSLLYAGCIALIQIFMSAMAGYSLARVDFKGKNLIFLLVIVTFLVPPQALLISQYLHFKQFDFLGLVTLFNGSTIDLINQPYTLYLLAFLGFGVNQSLFVFIFRQFFISLPKELEEAALIDGCGFYKTYFRIMLPNAMPPIMTVGILSFVWNYGDTYYTNYFHPEGPYLGVVIERMFAPSQRESINNALYDVFDLFITNNFTFDATKQAAVLIYLIPLLAVYFLVQRRLVENLERSGIVG